MIRLLTKTKPNVCSAGVDAAAITRAVEGFSGLEHALEPVIEIAGGRFVNDSKATNADAARQAMTASVVERRHLLNAVTLTFVTFSRMLDDIGGQAVVVFVLARTTGDPLHMILPMSATEEDYAEEFLALILAEQTSGVAPRHVPARGAHIDLKRFNLFSFHDRKPRASRLKIPAVVGRIQLTAEPRCASAGTRSTSSPRSR